MEYIPNNPLLKVGNFKNTGNQEDKKTDYYTADEFKYLWVLPLNVQKKRS